jgi:hypothetical protein
MLRRSSSCAVVLMCWMALAGPKVALGQPTPTPSPPSAAVKSAASSAAPEAASIPSDVTDKLAADLAQLQKEVLAAAQPTQPQPSRQVTVTSADGTPIFGGADRAAPKEYTAKKGDNLYVLDKANDFYAVAGPKNGETGWVAASDVKPIWLTPKDSSGHFAAVDYSDAWNKGKDYSDVDKAGYQTTNINNPPTQQDEGAIALMFKALTEKAVQFRDSYKNNEYVQVTGFTVHVALIPSIDLAFAFKTPTK